MCLYCTEDYCSFSRTYISDQALNPSILCACTLKRYQQGSLMAQALTSYLVDETTSYSKLNKELDTTVQLMRSYEENQVPASDFQGPTPGSGPCLRLPGSYPRGQGPASSFRFPASRPSDFFCLRINGNLP
ncbi:hypothetical protein F2Q68_00043112 [Brassica cretica]|uniref:Uncharacterized protein n=1 Tax=Brassica cretica TaxID=69181 RepID=A0A8S9LR99_BRACR|nr:hypothetical protein F2Q68_00043112 [Brassica cretica]